MGPVKRHNARDMLDRPNEWFPPSQLFSFANPVLYSVSHLSYFPPLPHGAFPSPYRCRFVHGPRRGFSVPPQFERVVCLASLLSGSTPPDLVTFSRPADGQPPHSGPGLTSSYSHRLDGRHCQYRNPTIRPFLNFLQNRHKLVSLPQEATNHLQISLCAVSQRFAH
jgi:hypothetical protein